MQTWGVLLRPEREPPHTDSFKVTILVGSARLTLAPPTAAALPAVRMQVCAEPVGILHMGYKGGVNEKVADARAAKKQAAQQAAQKAASAKVRTRRLSRPLLLDH